MHTFVEWLVMQEERDTPLGDFAREIAWDIRRHPDVARSLLTFTQREQWTHYLAERHACQGAQAAFTRAWRGYTQAVKRQGERGAFASSPAPTCHVDQWG
jgi:hypothetical protein